MSEVFTQFCDDIRQEANGKWMLIGCYGSAMVVPAFPYGNGLACFVTIKQGRSFSSMIAKYTLRSGAVIGQLQLNVEEVPDTAASIQIPLPPIPLQLSSPDEVVLSLAFDGEPLVEGGSIRIEAGQVAPSPFMAN